MPRIIKGNCAFCGGLIEDHKTKFILKQHLLMSASMVAIQKRCVQIRYNDIKTIIKVLKRKLTKKERDNLQKRIRSLI